jgi:hypothetical protein
MSQSGPRPVGISNDTQRHAASWHHAFGNDTRGACGNCLGDLFMAVFVVTTTGDETVTRATGQWVISEATNLDVFTGKETSLWK